MNESDYVLRTEYERLCQAINGGQEDFKRSIERLGDNNKEGHERIHDRLDDIQKMVRDSETKRISKVQAVLYAFMSSAIVALLIIVLTK